MKTVNSLLLVVVLLLGFYFLDRQKEDEAQPSSFLPTDTLVYLDQKNGGESIERFLNSRIGRILRTIDLPDVLRAAETDSRYPQLAETILSQLARLHRDSLVQELLARRCTLALFGRRDWTVETDNVGDYLKNHLLLISKPQTNIEQFDALLASYIRPFAVSVAPYGRYTIRRIEIDPEMTVSVTYADGMFLAAFEERVLRESLDLHDRKRSTLRNDAGFQNTIGELDGAERLLYFSVEGLQALASSVAGLLPDPQEQAVLLELSSFKGVASVAYGEWRQKRILRNRCIVRLNPQTMDDRVRHLIATSPSLNDTLPYVAKDVLLYYWSNTLDLKLLWEMYVSEAGAESEEVLNLQESVREVSGYELKELIGMFSSNVGIMINESERDQFVPIPDFALLLKLRDASGVERAVEKMLASFGIKVQSGKYKGVRYYSWGIYPRESVQPVYAIHRNHLILANTMDILRKIIDTPINNTRLVATKGFRELDPGFQTLNNSVCYIDQARLLARVQDFVGWAGTMLAIQDRNMAEKSKMLIDKFIDPLFWGLSMYETSATRTYVRDNRIFIEARTRITN